MKQTYAYNIIYTVQFLTHYTYSKTAENHHFASNVNNTYTEQFKRITDKYGLDFDGDWNKKMLPHRGRHPNAYHKWVLDQLKIMDDMAQGDTQLFLELFGQMVRSPVISNPGMLYSKYWKRMVE